MVMQVTPEMQRFTALPEFSIFQSLDGKALAEKVLLQQMALTRLGTVSRKTAQTPSAKQKLPK